MIFIQGVSNVCERRYIFQPSHVKQQIPDIHTHFLIIYQFWQARGDGTQECRREISRKSWTAKSSTQEHWTTIKFVCRVKLLMSDLRHFALLKDTFNWMYKLILNGSNIQPESFKAFRDSLYLYLYKFNNNLIGLKLNVFEHIYFTK